MMSVSWRLVVSVVLFFLLWEWVRPLVALSYVTDLYVVEPLLIAMGCFIILDMLRCPAWAGWPVKLALCVAIIGYFYHHSFLNDLTWWVQYKHIIVQDMMNLRYGHIGISAENRTLLLLIGLALMISIVQSLMFTWQSSGYFVVATIMYLVMLQVWAGVDTTAGIMRGFGYGLALLVVLHLGKIERVYDVKLASTGTRRWLMASLVVMGLTMIAGLAAAQYKGESTLLTLGDPASFMNSKLYAQLEKLSHPIADGQSFAENPSQAAVARSGYDREQSIELGGNVTLNDEIVFIAQTAGQMYWRGDSKGLYDGKGWHAGEHYLQLPESLPERINELAVAVIGGETDPMEQAKRIERYLKTNYTYNLADPVYPPAEQDFVDHFLFDQQFGYCDHFSSAMVVMLRSVGVPARWVRGYSAGEESMMTFEQLKLGIPDHTKHSAPLWLEEVAMPGKLVQSDASFRNVIVRHLHAHSWVEAYLPTVGWVSFEPTAVASIVNSDISLNHDTSNIKHSLAYSTLQRLKQPSIIALYVTVALLILLFVRRVVHHHLFWKSINDVLRNKGRGRGAVNLRHVERLWLQVFKRFGPIQEAQTVREYVTSLHISNKEVRDKLNHLVTLYEVLRYDLLTPSSLE